MGLDISTVVDISTRIAAGGVPRLDFGQGLLITADDTLPAGGTGKARRYSGISEVNAAFDAGDLLDAATVWFSADPPPRSLYIGRWAVTDVPTTLKGGTPGAVGDIAVINASFEVGGNDVQVDLSSVIAGTYADIAALIQTELQALADTRFSGVLFVYDTDGFLMTLTGADDVGVFSGSATGTDISALLAMDEGPSTYRLGHNEESVVDAVGEMLALATGGMPLPLMVDETVPGTHNAIDTKEALAAYAQANNMIFGLRDTSSQVFVTNDATSQGALAIDRQQGNVVAIATQSGTFPDIALLAEMSAQNLNQPASIVTPHVKPLPGAQTTAVTQAQLAELKRKRVNVYTVVGTLPSLLEGYTSRSGYWLDAVWWLKWFQNELELNIFNAQRASRRLNNAILSDVLFAVGQSGVSNGGLMPGKRVNAGNKQDIIQTTGNNNFDGVLTSGFLFWIESTNDRSDLDTENRIGRFKMWGVGSEVIHKVFGDIVFQN